MTLMVANNRRGIYEPSNKALPTLRTHEPFVLSVRQHVSSQVCCSLEDNVAGRASSLAIIASGIRLVFGH